MVKTKLQSLRIDRGLSQEALADLIGMTQSNYSRKETGHSRISTPEWVHIAKKLNVELDEIYEDDDPTIIYKNNRGNSFNSGTININMPEILIEYIEVLKEQNERLKMENESLRNQLENQ